MNSTPASGTSPTLLGRLRLNPDDRAAWTDFVARYNPLILSWCRRSGLQEADADDVAQQVLLLLAAKLRTFAYDPAKSFRAWLRTLTRHALSDYHESRQRGAAGTGDSRILDVLNNVEAREGLLAELDRQFDLELLEAAAARVRLRVEPQTWDAFRLTALEGVAGDAAAQQLGLRLTAVYKAKSRVQSLIREEMDRLDGGASAGAGTG